jgi:hypothetical protein
MIGEKTVNSIGEAVIAALLDHLPELDKAYAATDEGSFPISVALKIKPCAEGNRIEVSIGFVTGRVRTSEIRIVNENQTSFLDDVQSIEMNGETVFEREGQ